MKEVFIDTLFFIAYASRNDVHFRKAYEWADWIVNAKPSLHYHDGILLEIGDGFAGRGYAEKGVSLVEDLICDPLAVRHPLTSELVDQAIAFQKSHTDKRWGLTDCVSFVIMREYGLTAALTADRHFSQAGFRALLHESPPE